MKKKLRAFIDDEKAASAVEFALIAPLLPYGRTGPKIRITGIEVSGTEKDKKLSAQVDWSRPNLAGFAGKAGGSAELPKTLMTEGAYYIRVDVELDYKPLNSWVASSILMRETYFLAQRYQYDPLQRLLKPIKAVSQACSSNALKCNMPARERYDIE
nr:hypothetical protein [Ochrobactrum sp. CM-21-5]